jgi:flavin-dependent dehydrogenase
MLNATIYKLDWDRALAEVAHEANAILNASTAAWNRLADRRGVTRGNRTTDGITIPDTALHLPLSGEVRKKYGIEAAQVALLLAAPRHLGFKTPLRGYTTNGLASITSLLVIRIPRLF